MIRPRLSRCRAAASLLFHVLWITRPLFVTCLLLSVAAANAAVPLSVEADVSVVGRTEGPIPLTLRLKWGGPGVFDGWIAMSLVDAYEGTLARFETDELYLSEGTQEYQFLLPAFPASGAIGELELRIACVTGRERHALPAVQLRVPTIDQRRLLILTAGDGSTQSPAVNRFVTSLKLEPFNPLPDKGQLSTANQSLTSDRFPEDPLSLCAYDLIVLPPGELERLNPRQRGAVLAWIRAGGSLVVFPDGKPVRPVLEFLERLAAEGNRSDVTFVVNGQGALLMPENDGPILLRIGLGRVVVATEGALQLSLRNDPAWREAIAFLWKLQHAHLSSVVESGVWNLDVAREAANRHGISRGWNMGQIADEDAQTAMASRIAPISLSGGSGMLSHMLPSGMTLVPFGLMVLLLLLYVAAIGPFDYWFLGLLRQRKLTWFLFPATTIGFTAFAVWISNTFMATVDHRSCVVIRDVGDDGAVLRESQFELLFPSRTATISTELRRALYTPVSHDEFIAADWQYNPYSNYRQAPRGQSAPPLIAGRPPQRLQVSQQIAQWTPQLNRTLTIPRFDRDDDDEQATQPTFDWNLSADWRSIATTEDAARQIRHAFGDGAQGYLYHGQERRAICGPEQLFTEVDSIGRQTLNQDGEWVWTPFDFLQDLCVRRQPGWFGIVSQTSPGCGRTSEDLALLDPTDLRTWLLVIGVRNGNDTILYRKLYRKEQPQ
ncbi:MAG: hypothetical protein KF861_04040 [Planctomycetaceae bacterium]|nr:hypothetical protein [Planctomycetaceae bacterium]